MDKPTDEQIEMFWEWCGATRYDLWSSNGQGFKFPNGDKHSNMPLVDLNNLFKYAVPKLEECHLITVRPGMYYAIAKLSGRVTDAENEDPALALFWAIYGIVCNNTSYYILYHIGGNIWLTQKNTTSYTEKKYRRIKGDIAKITQSTESRLIGGIPPTLER